MSLLPKLSDLFPDNPLHNAMKDMQSVVSDARKDLHSLVCSLQDDTNTTCVVNPTKSQPKKVVKPIAQPEPVYEVPSEEDTAIELKHRLLEQIADAEDDLEHEMKIRKADGTYVCCSCLSGKHDVKIKAKCLELMPKDASNPIYREIYNWFENNKNKMTLAGCQSGEYKEEYIKMANEMGDFRRRLQKQLSGTQYSGDAIKGVKDFLKDKGYG